MSGSGGWQPLDRLELCRLAVARAAPETLDEALGDLDRTFAELPDGPRPERQPGWY